MTKELSALLRKKSWTGDEIGKAILYSLVDAHRQALEGVAKPSPVFPPDQLQLMIGSLSDPAQLRRYNSYVGLQNWLIQYQAVSTAYFKQAAGELDVISGVLSAALAVEADLQSLDKMPLLFSRKQYDDLVALRAAEQLVDEEGKDRTYSVWRTLVLAVAYWVMLLELHPEKENPLRELREAYKSQPVTSTFVLDAYDGKKPPSKWDVLVKGKLRTYYPAMSGKDASGFEEQARDFQREFGEVCSLMLQDMDRALQPGIPFFEGLPPEEWGNPACSIRTLYHLDLYDIKKMIEGDRNVFRFDEKVQRKGYAIVSNEFAFLADERGYYKGWDRVLQISVKCGLEQYTALNTGREQAVDQLIEGRKTVEDGYYYVKGYDKAISLIADFLAMPEFSIFQLGAKSLEERMRELEDKVQALRQKIQEGDYGTDSSRQAKLGVLQSLFPPFAWDQLEIPKAAEEEAKALLTDHLRAFDKQDNAFISILTSREGRV